MRWLRFGSSTPAVWSVVAIVAVHIAATVLAYDRALLRFGAVDALRGQ